MNYSFFLFSKLYSVFFYEDDDLEYDLLFEKLTSLYEDYQASPYNDPEQDEYSCIRYYFLNRQIELGNDTIN